MSKDSTTVEDGVRHCCELLSDLCEYSDDVILQAIEYLTENSDIDVAIIVSAALSYNHREQEKYNGEY